MARPNWMLPQWPWVVCATTLQFPSNGEAIADDVEEIVAEAAAKALAEIRLPIIGVLQFPVLPVARRQSADMKGSRRVYWPAMQYHPTIWVRTGSDASLRRL